MHYLYKVLILLGMIISLSHAADLTNSYIKLNRHTVHYYQTEPAGAPLILLTGYATTSNFWNSDFVNCLAAAHTVYLLDYQGINLNNPSLKHLSIRRMAQDVNAFATKLKLTKPSLVGWSMGGGVALEASFLAPTLYQHLYLLGSIVPVNSKQSLLLPQHLHLASHNDNDILNYVFGNNLYAYDASQLNQLRTKFINNQNQISQLFTESSINALQHTAIERWEYAITTRHNFAASPVTATFYIPDRDTMINEKIAQAVIKNYPQAEIIKVPNSGHALAWQVPAQLCQDINSHQ